MQGPNWLWLIWKWLPFICPLPKFHWEIRYRSQGIAQYVSHNSPSNSFPAVVPGYFLFGSERNGLILSHQCWHELKLTISLFMRRDFVVAFPFLKMSFSAKHDLDSDSGIVMSIQPCHFKPRQLASVTSHWIQSEPLHQCESKVRHVAFQSILWSTKLYISKLEGVSQWNFGNGQLKGRTFK